MTRGRARTGGGERSIIEAIVFDIDGVLTDGTVEVGGGGRRRLFLRDLDALTLARRAGLQVAFLTGEDSPEVRELVDRCGGGEAVFGGKEKAAGLAEIATRLGLPLEAVCYVADAGRDVDALRLAGLALAPADASAAARGAAARVLCASAGRGAVAEAVDLALRFRDDDLRVDRFEAIVKETAACSREAHERFWVQCAPVVVQVAHRVTVTLRRGGKLLLFGNGGSAAIAQHAAAELVDRFGQDRGPLPAIALGCDSSALAAVGNGMSLEGVFARQVRALARPGDLAVGLSTSGRSVNVLSGLAAARELGAETFGLTGADGGEMAACCDLCLRVPSESAPRIQELHVLAWHLICECVESA